jgi:hypothetical protein
MANISALATTAHTVTAAEAANGFAQVHVTWPSPFYDTNYVTTFSVEDISGLPPGVNLAVGDKHNVTPQGFDAIILLASIPIVQAKQTDIGVSVPEDLHFTLLATTTYNVTLYYQSLGTGDDSTLFPTITWVDPQGNPQSLTYPYLGTISGDGSNQGLLQNYSIPFLALGGSVLDVSTQFQNSTVTGPGNPFAYNLSLSIVAMPETAADQTGTKFVVHAMASHR